MLTNFAVANLSPHSVQLHSADRISHKALQSGIIDSGRWIGDLEGKGDALSESTNLSASDNPESAGKNQEGGQIANDSETRSGN